MNNSILLPPEWTPQSGVMITWPHEETDWAYMLDEAVACFKDLAREISKRERLLVVCKDEVAVRQALGDVMNDNITFRVMETNDTWARDHGPITVFVEGKPTLYDFQFNGWGLKFASNFDNQITRKLYGADTFSSKVGYANLLHYVLEGGSIESDGEGTLMTTAECLLSKNRNEHLQKEEVEEFLKSIFGLERILWLNHGYLAGDDTDSHVDTLARFCDAKTIAYVKCDDPSDEHYEALKAMEDELKSFKDAEGNPYRLVALPMAEKRYEDDFRLPATYANFLIMNGAVLMPTYRSERDAEAIAALQSAFPDREVVGVDCSALIHQHGSLHCVTMQMPEGVLAD
ncbi:MAG: agmatine deiminase family protein [Paludibacteraceae bacterium]|nr:agmatine deiminase family protein [Paludibacteraceae bacterium]